MSRRVFDRAPQQTFAINPDDEDDLMQGTIEDEKFQKEAINENVIAALTSGFLLIEALIPSQPSNVCEICSNTA
jgi:hypothetical protein